MKIADLKVGSVCEITLVVKSATARETKAKKPYLALEFFDGVDTIGANYWDWTSGNIPDVNSILDIKGQVTEWQGTKQLTVKAMSLNTERHLADFAPASDINLEHVYKCAYGLMTNVTDDDLRSLALGVLEDLRELWLTVPGAASVHHAFIGGTLVHSWSVAEIAGAIALTIPEANYDLTVVGAMLHDLGKLFTYNLNGIAIDVTEEGMLYEHIFMGAEFIGNYAENKLRVDDPIVERKVALLRHIILSHHGKLEYGSPVTPQCIEAYIVHCADMIDATTEQIREASKKTSEHRTGKMFYLSNRPHLTPLHIGKVFSSKE